MNARVSQAEPNAAGILVHSVQSEYQSESTDIKVLLPESATAPGGYRVLYVLPVEVLDGCQFGNAFAEILRYDLHNKHQLICVMPTFCEAPWYVDHPTDTHRRHESYFIQVVLPFVERTYNVRSDCGGRLLIGFSKSGCGAWSMLLRHVESFGKAAAWDAPLGMASYTRYGAGRAFGTQENFERYNIWQLLKQNADQLTTGKPRFALLGHGDFRGHVQATHVQMQKLGIAHDYRDGPRRAHHWESGWLTEAVEILVADHDGSQ